MNARNRIFEQKQYKFGKIMYDLGFDGYIRIQEDNYVITLYNSYDGFFTAETTTDITPVYETVISQLETPEEIVKLIQNEAPELFL